MGRTLHPGFSFPSCAGPPTWGLGGWEGQERLSRTLALDGLTAHPSCQDLPDSVHDAAQIQLPHRGSAFHDETGEALSGPTDPLTRQPCPGDFSQPQGFCPGPFLCLEHSSCHLSAPVWPPQAHLPHWTVSHLRAETVLASALSPGLTQ